MIDPHAVLQSLSKRRPIFHSEADFQHEFAWELRAQYPDGQIRLEVPSTGEGVGTTDIMVRNGDAVHGIELKYLTRRHHCVLNGEAFSLKAQGAHDQKRHAVLKDVQRLERFNLGHGGPSFVLALSNDASYWNQIGRGSTIDAAFRLYEGRMVEGPLAWAEQASPGTTRGSTAIDLAGQYELAWCDYSDLQQVGCRFRYLAIQID